ncbi:MAG TPA: ankyrin repeat domain-containing protein [Novosphingobium sp.]|nr:ankyrin repeat domain-containing protein [Novosphingobium sp.]
MLKFARFFRGVPVRAGLALVLAAGLVAPAEAQFSKAYKFLDAVRKKDGDEVNDDLSQPGTTLINTHDSTSGETALHIVTGRRDSTWMRFLIGKGAEVNTHDNRGVTPLQLASNIGFAEGVDILLQNGARVDETDSLGDTPLMAAVQRRDIAMMRVLLKAGANPDRADNTGRSAREYARENDRSGNLLEEIESYSKQAKVRSTAGYGPHL